MKHISFLMILMLFALPLQAARIKHIQDVKTLPENEAEQALWEIAVGHQDNIREEGRLVEDAQLETYLDTIGKRLLGNRLDHLDVQIKFIVVQNNLLSAWVYPYGTIAVNTGLLAGMENEAQLAAIIGHELSHFLQRHSYRELVADKRQSAVGKGLGLLATAAVAAKTGVVDTAMMQAGGLWSDLVTSGYSRKNEHAADAEGLALLAAAGYDQAQAIRAFEILKQNDAYGVVSPRLLWSSHPTLDDRLKNLQKAVRKAERKKGYQAGEVPDSDTYARAVAGAILRTGAQDLRERYFDRAASAFRKYVHAQPEDPRGYFLLGETDRLAAPDGPDFSRRVTAYQQAVQAREDYAPAYLELGMAARQQGQVDTARQAFERYLSLAPEAADVGIVRWYLENL